MRHADDEIERAAKRFEQLAYGLDPEIAVVEQTDDLREIAAVSDAVRADEARVREAVEVARADATLLVRVSGQQTVKHAVEARMVDTASAASTPSYTGGWYCMFGRTAAVGQVDHVDVADGSTASLRPRGVGLRVV